LLGRPSVRENAARGARLAALVAILVLAAGCVGGRGAALVAGNPAGAVRSPVPTFTALPDSDPTASARPPAPSATPWPRPTALPTATPAPLPAATPTATADPYTFGGVRLTDGDTPFTLRYPRSLDAPGQVVVEGIEILVSDADGANLKAFSNIGAWLGQHKIFVYPDTASGRPVLSIHDGTYAGVPLEAEPLRQLIEGSFRAPYSLEDIAENLRRLQGQRFELQQGEAVAVFEVIDGVRMDAETTLAFRERPGELSTLLQPFPRPEDTLLILICSTRQPDEPEEIFPARYVLALQLVR